MEFLKTNPQIKTLIEIDELNQKESLFYIYHKKHIDLVCEYALIINEKLNANLNPLTLAMVSYAHDIFKESALNKDRVVLYNDKEIPQDLRKYIDENKSVLSEYGMDDYTDNFVNHAMASAIFIIKELNIADKNVIYPVLFHSCPIISIYKTLDKETQTYVDIIQLADKLSSNYLKLNNGKKVRCFLEEIVFGKDNEEFNYTIGLFLARLISKGKDEQKFQKESLDYYEKRVKDKIPFFKFTKLKDLGEKKIWENQKSKVLKSVKNDSLISETDVK